MKQDTMMTMESKVKSKSSRIIGYDLARSLAVLGMVLVNFKVVMGADHQTGSFLAWVAGLFDGRAAATFVVLAGVGLSLVSRKARHSGDRLELAHNRRQLLKRALFLFVVGLSYAPLWPADILHFYGVYMVIGVMLLAAPARWLWSVATSLTGLFVVLILTLDFDTGWNWETLTYMDFWTAQGMLRHLFFNGFHPVIPWAAFLLVGMWLGRQDLTQPQVRRRILVNALAVAVPVEIASRILVNIGTDRLPHMALEDIQALFGTSPIPPMPLYMLAAGAMAMVVIVLSVMVAERFGHLIAVKALVHTGQLALSLYVAHVVLGMGVLEALGRLENQSLGFALTSALFFWICGVVCAHFWRLKFSKGPLEWVMRKVTG